MPIKSRGLSVKAEMATGTDCKVSVRFCAVTTISSNPVAPSLLAGLACVADWPPGLDGVCECAMVLSAKETTMQKYLRVDINSSLCTNGERAGQLWRLASSGP